MAAGSGLWVVGCGLWNAGRNMHVILSEAKDLLFAVPHPRFLVRHGSITVSSRSSSRSRWCKPSLGDYPDELGSLDVVRRARTPSEDRSYCNRCKKSLMCVK